MGRRRGPALCTIGPVWTQRTASASKIWNAIAFGNPASTTAGIFVAGGGNPGGGGTTPTMFSLNSGVTWANSSVPPVFSGSSQIPAQNLAYGAGIFVAINGGGVDNCATSVDGDVWVSGINIAGNTTSVFHDGVKFIALCSGAGQCFTSSTGAVGTWTARTMPAVDSWTVGGVGGGVTIAIAQSGNTAVSVNNGTSWTSGGVLPLPTAVSIYGRVPFGNGTFVAIPNAPSNQCFYSTDLSVSWHLSTAVAGLNAYSDAGFYQGLFTVVDAGGQDVIKGVNGINYTASGLLPVNGAAIWNFASDGLGKYAAVGSLSAGTTITASGVC